MYKRVEAAATKEKKKQRVRQYAKDDNCLKYPKWPKIEMKINSHSELARNDNQHDLCFDNLVDCPPLLMDYLFKVLSL